jgi:hypothetical protein
MKTTYVWLLAEAFGPVEVYARRANAVRKKVALEKKDKYAELRVWRVKVR